MNILLTMVRKNLECIPHYALPRGFACRWYEPGDEVVWARIQAAADKYNKIGPDLFHAQFGSDERALRERQFFIVDPQGSAAGTATAWFGEDGEGTPLGRVHWVAITPPMQGLGLGRPLMTIVCERLRALGHRRAYLTTSSARIPALNLYLKFGFVPEPASEQEAQAWAALRGTLRYPYPSPPAAGAT